MARITTKDIPKAKMQHIVELVNKTLDGDRVASAVLVETISTSDAPFALTALINKTVMEKYPEAPKIWPKIAERKVVSNFGRIRWYDMDIDVTNLEHTASKAPGVLPVIPELSPYPYVGFKKSETDFGLQKYGVKFGWSWEEEKNDVAGFISDLPQMLVKTAADTEDFNVIEALVNGVTTANRLAEDTTFGTVINAPLSFDALNAAFLQRSQRKVNGRPIVTGRTVLLVDPSQEFLANTIVSRTEIRIKDDNISGPAGQSMEYTTANPFAGIEVVTTDKLQLVDPINGATFWAILPAPGTTRRPGLLSAFMIGEETPDLRVFGLQGGAYPSGGQVPFTMGSFDNDSLDWRLRMVHGAGLIAGEAIVWSNGTGTA